MVVLTLLLVMTLLGLASLRGTLLEERMSANLFDRSLGFQAVEAAMREAEAVLALPATHEAFPTSGCTSAGLCATPVVTNTERWKDSSFANWKTATVNLGPAAIAPQYYIEYMGEAPSWAMCEREVPVQANCMTRRYRITARSEAANRAQVLLQSSYAAS